MNKIELLGKNFAGFTIPVKALNEGETYYYKYRLVMCITKNWNNNSVVRLVTNDQEDCISINKEEYLKSLQDENN